MITLITGTPGAGKTAWIVQELTRLPSQRKIYVHGIPELKIAHEPIYCMSELCEMCRSVPAEIIEDSHACFVEDWPEWSTEGSLLVVDEVQYIWRPGNSSSKLPYGIAALETHRHKGLDFWLISQGPHLFHSNIRLLIGRHIHLVANWRGRTEYEFPECRQNTSSRSDAITRPYRLPKKVFSLYKSASMHTKLDKRLPISFYVAVAALLLLAFYGVRIYNVINSKTQPSVAEVKSPSGPQTQATLGAGGGGQGGDNKPVSTASTFVVPAPPMPDFEPRQPGVLESAPAYAHLLKVTEAPLLAGCVYSVSKDECKCYTRQATPYPASKNYCLEQVKNHRFNPYLQRSAQAAPSPGNPANPISTINPLKSDAQVPIQPPNSTANIRFASR